MEVSTPFDAALSALLAAWKVRDDLRQAGNDDHDAIRAAWLELDDARVWAREASMDGQWRFIHTDDPRGWLSAAAAGRIAEIGRGVHGMPVAGIDRHLHRLVQRTNDIHLRESVNLNPATNVMNPRAEALLSAGLGSRPSLGHPGEKYEMGLEAVEEVEVLAVHLARAVFGARHAEVRVPSGAMANLMALMATCRPGDAIIVPPPEVGGHVTHHQAGAAGLYGLQIHHAPIDADRYTVDPAGLAKLAEAVRPAVITLGASMNLAHHPVPEVRAIADDVGARLLFDAAHLCGPIAGGAWPNPLSQGAHLMTMSTYKSLAGPPGGMVLTDDDGLAERLDAIAYPGLTANFDVGRVAALAITLLDWIEHGAAYARVMVEAAALLGRLLDEVDVPRISTGEDASHQLAVDATGLGGGPAAAAHLRQANLLTSAIGLPRPPVAGQPAGLRIGTPEIVRFGMAEQALPQLAAFIGQAWHAADPARLARKVARFRSEFTRIHFIRDAV